MNEKQPISFASRGKIYLGLGRVSNIPTVWSNCLAGWLLAGGTPNPADFALLALAVTFFYTGGMFLNDGFDHAWDAKNRPDRPIPSGTISLEEVFAAGFFQVLAGLGLLIVVGWKIQPEASLQAMGGGVALAAVIVYYDFRHKRDPLSPLIMAFTRALVYFIAAAIATATFGSDVWAGMAVLLCYLIGLTYVAKQETLREVKNLWPLIFLVIPFIYSFPLLQQVSGESVLFVILLLWVSYALSFLLRQEGRNIPRAVVSLIAGISLLDGVLIGLVDGGPWAWAAAAGFPLTLFLQRYVAGT